MKNYFKSWDFMRLLRLVIGVIALVQSIYTKDFILGIAAFIIGGMALFNVGCCGANGCSTSFTNKKINKNNEVDFEEVVAEK